MRLKIDQERHDAEVLRVGNQAINIGWKTVFADLPGCSKPPVIYSYIPDVYGTDGLNEFIVEVETADTRFSHDILQHDAFRRWQRESPARRNFQVFVV